MAKMVNLRKTATQRKAEEKSSGKALSVPDSEGEMMIHLDPHHVSKMGLADGTLKGGDKVSFQGEGRVHSVSSTSDGDGDERHHVTLALHKGGVEHYPEDGERDAGARQDIRKDLSKAASKYE
jgi:hypothetical protein